MAQYRPRIAKLEEGKGVGHHNQRQKILEAMALCMDGLLVGQSQQSRLHVMSV